MWRIAQRRTLLNIHSAEVFMKEERGRVNLERLWLWTRRLLQEKHVQLFRGWQRGFENGFSFFRSEVSTAQASCRRRHRRLAHEKHVSLYSLQSKLYLYSPSQKPEILWHNTLLGMKVFCALFFQAASVFEGSSIKQTIHPGNTSRNTPAQKYSF